MLTVRKAGARVADSVADAVKDADLVLTSLAGAEAIEEVYFGDLGIVPHAPPGCLIVDLSSVRLILLASITSV